MATSSKTAALLLFETLTFAAQKHSFQKRKNALKSPYIQHPILVSHLIAESFHPNEAPVWILQAGLLHDTVEDCDCTLEELREVFGERVERIVDECTDDTSLPSVERKAAQIVHAPVISDDAS